MSCKKGDTGPAGPAGPDSVMYSSWITLNMTGTTTSAGDSVYYQSITAKAITSDALNKGSVIGYLLVNDPLTGDSSVINASLAFEEHFLVGSITILSSVTYTDYQYRYVVVPSRVAVTSSNGQVQTYTSQQMSLMDYSTLTGLLHVPATGSGTSKTLTSLTN
jgi:hypothetical protein